MEFPLPELGEGVYEAEFVAWLVQVGDSVRRGQNLMEVLTDKATMEVPSPFAGTITALNAEPGQEIKIGAVVLTYEPGGEADNAKQAATPKKKVSAATSSSNDLPRTFDDGRTAVLAPSSVKAAPSIRLMARKLGIDLQKVTASGPSGRILFDDLTNHVHYVGGSVRDPNLPVAERPGYAGGSLRDMKFGTPGERIRLIGLRRKIAEHMVKATSTVPHYGYVDECDVTDLVRIRESLKESRTGKSNLKKGIRLTYLPFFVKAVTRALKEVPLVNASLDEEAGEIVLHDKYHIGIAVAAPGGLVVPVVHDADKKDILSIAAEIEQLSDAVRNGSIRREQLQEGTFTITSIGSIGGLFSTPVINFPEVGILGIGKIVKRPVFDDSGNVRPADLVYLSFSFDHRVVDGAVGAVFGNSIIRELQKPAGLLLDT